ncbi:ATP-binding cassette domain-containing protein [Paenibacillus sp. NPDC057967]|uniref:ATP-binding cassette domain-containing protein n=1 Tax=Paenibacillus sp. NPDC057967 TaxID=3346293 RepID=UPI0036DCD081
MSLAIEVNQLRKSYRNREVVKGIDLAIRQGELFALLGPNGAGKTTVVEMLSTLILPDGGTARIGGRDVVKEAAAVRGKISLTGQFAALDEGMSGFENLAMFAKLYGYSWKEARRLADELLPAFGLEEARHRLVEQYSGGMRRRLDIAASVLAQPEVIFLDEPTTGLDPQSRLQVWEVVRSLLKQGTTVLLTTQYLEEADRLADRIAVLDEGRIIAEGTPRELKAAVGGKTLTIRLKEQVVLEPYIRLLADDHGLHITRDEEDPLMIKVPSPDERLASRAIQTLMDHHCPVVEFALSEPSLDEVFLSLTDARNKEAVS